MNHKFNNNIIEIFPSIHIMEFEISHDPKEVVQKLNPYISAGMATHELLVNSNAVMTSRDTPWRPTGNSSYKTSEHILKKKEFSSLKEEILCCVKEYNKKYRIHNKDIKLENSWFNVMPKDSQLIFHIHNGSLLSGTYYPFLPEGSADLAIIDPEYVKSLIISGKSVKDLEEKSKSKDDNRERKTIPIKEGHLYVFPSWLEHGTLNNNCDKRIVISFNTTFSDVGKSGNMLQAEFEGEELEEYLKGVRGGKKHDIQQLFNQYRPTAAKAISSSEDASLVHSKSLYYES